jgi:hypothetical protein
VDLFSGKELFIYEDVQCFDEQGTNSWSVQIYMEEHLPAET